MVLFINLSGNPHPEDHAPRDIGSLLVFHQSTIKIKTQELLDHLAQNKLAVNKACVSPQFISVETDMGQKVNFWILSGV